MKILCILPLVLTLCMADAKLPHQGPEPANGEIQISTAKQLAELDVSPGTRYVLGSDIELPPNWVPIGSAAHPFQGKFDGRGHVIRGLDISGAHVEPQGLFGTVQDAEISDLVLEDPKIELSGDITGGPVVGTAINSRIYNVVICGGAITTGGTGTVGGIVGHIMGRGQVVDCESSAAVTGGIAGGIVGRAVGTSLTTNANHELAIMRCISTGDVTATGGMAGGLIGQGAFVLIEDGASYGVVTGQNVGGFVGELADFSRVLYSYARGDVFSCGLGGSVGGFVGEIARASCIEFSYSGGAVAAHANVQSRQEWSIGGFAGMISATDAPTTITHSFSFAPWVVGPVESSVQRFVGSLPNGGVNGCYAVLSSMVVMDGELLHVLPSAFGADGGDVSNAQVETLAKRLGWRREINIVSASKFPSGYKAPSQ